MRRIRPDKSKPDQAAEYQRVYLENELAEKQLAAAISETGPAHDKVFDVEVLVEGKSIGQGQGRSKKLAEQEAAKNAVEKGLDSCI